MNIQNIQKNWPMAKRQCKKRFKNDHWNHVVHYDSVTISIVSYYALSYCFLFLMLKVTLHWNFQGEAHLGILHVGHCWYQLKLSKPTTQKVLDIKSSLHFFENDSPKFIWFVQKFDLQLWSTKFLQECGYEFVVFLPSSSFISFK